MSDATTPRLAGRVTKVAFLALALAAGWLLAAPRIVDWQRQAVARELLARAAADLAAASSLTREAAKLGPAAYPALIRLALDDHPAAAAARDALTAETAVWQAHARLPRRQDSALACRRLVTLTRLLADAVRQHPPASAEAALWTTRIAQRLLRTADATRYGDSWQAVAACDQILGTARPGRTARPRLGSPAAPSAARSPAAAALPTTALRPEPWDVAPSPSRSPSAVESNGALGDEQPGSGSVPPAYRETTADPTPASETPASEITLSDQAPNQRPDPPQEVAADMAWAQSAQPLVAVDAEASSPSAAKPRFIPTPQQMHRELGRLRRQSTAALRLQHAGADPFVAALIDQVLAERLGQSAMEHATTHLPSPTTDDHGVTLDSPRVGGLADQLLSLPPGRAASALRSWAEHPDAAVREEALAILATTADPQATPILQRRAIAEQDPRLADLAARLLQRRTATR